MSTKTDPNANPPIIQGYTDPASYNAAYHAGLQPAVRKAIDSAGGNNDQREQNLAALVPMGYLIDPIIDAFVNFQSTAWEVTLQRLRYSVSMIAAWNPSGGPPPGFLPVPPNITPIPDPPQNIYAGTLWRLKADYATMGVQVPGDVYNALPAGWGLMPGVQVTDTDGYIYVAHGQFFSGDPIALMVRVS